METPLSLAIPVYHPTMSVKSRLLALSIGDGSQVHFQSPSKAKGCSMTRIVHIRCLAHRMAQLDCAFCVSLTEGAPFYQLGIMMSFMTESPLVMGAADPFATRYDAVA